MNNHTAARAKSESPLIGRIYDDRGNRMSPSHARKQGIRYRYYVSSPLLQGQAGDAGSVRRAEIEALVGQAVREHLKDSALPDADLIRALVLRVDERRSRWQDSPIPNSPFRPLLRSAKIAAVERGIGVTRLRDGPADWGRQYAMLGLSV